MKFSKNPVGTLVGTFEKYPPLTHWVKVGRIVSEPSMYSAWTHWVIDPLPPVSGSVAARRRLKCLSLAPYYVAQMKRCMQKWDRCDNQGPNSSMIDTCRQ